MVICFQSIFFPGLLCSPPILLGSVFVNLSVLFTVLKHDRHGDLLAVENMAALFWCYNVFFSCRHGNLLYVFLFLTNTVAK